MKVRVFKIVSDTNLKGVIMMKIKGREYRNMAPLVIQQRAQGEEPNYRAEGYATTFDTPYLLYEYDGIKYYEQVSSGALDGADMSDVVCRFDHTGHVYARTKNGTLTLTVDGHGLKTVADLSTTEAARQMHEEIRTGLIDKMSWAFTVAEDSYNSETRTRTILKIKKVYDVSPVTFPADADTDISARSFIDGVIAKEQAEGLARRKKALSMLIDSYIGKEKE